MTCTALLFVMVYDPDVGPSANKLDYWKKPIPGA